ncbi:MAG TPA: YraN family protein [Kiritimatiellia bacterium]|nr:YraN family protein [Kiritimatiellia bacterium]HSA16826.1 YraN family protein [Kiritimatiellia bacterium]
MLWPFGKKKNGAEDARHRAGKWGEQQAERHLRGLGFGILARRFRVGRRDEIDLIARDGDTLVFVEVKTRASEEFGAPIASVKGGKRHALSRAAIRYMMQMRSKPDYFRFDVVEVIGAEGRGTPEIRHTPNAFTLHPDYNVPW